MSERMARVMAMVVMVVMVWARVYMCDSMVPQLG